MATLLDSTEVTECDIMVDRVQANVVKVFDKQKGDQEQKKISRIRETKHLSTDADISTDTIKIYIFF